MARFTPWNKTKDCYIGSRGEHAEVGRRKLIRGGPDCPGAFGVPSRGTAVLLVGTSLFLRPFSSSTLLLRPTSSSSSAHGMADQNVAVKKADPLPGSLVRPSPHLLRSRSPHVERRTNDQRNVNRKPREATLINPTEINCGAQRRSSVSLFLSPFLARLLA